MHDLSPIMDYQMTEMEQLAYHICLEWINLSRKVFKDYKHDSGLPKKGDPRKCTLFKYSYKLARETQGLLKPDEYYLYIKAQLDILKAITKHSDLPFIGPNVLVGDKAWVRWKMWKKHYDIVCKKKDGVVEAKLDTISLEDIKKQLDQTKKFLTVRFNGEPKEEQVKLLHSDMRRWIGIGKVSPFYAILSPWVKKYVEIVNIDPTQYENSVTNEVVQYFKSIFPNEVF